MTTYTVSVNAESGNMTTSQQFAVQAETVEAAQEQARTLATTGDGYLRPDLVGDAKITFFTTYAVEGYTPTMARVDMETDEYGLCVRPWWLMSDGTEASGHAYGLPTTHKALADRLRRAMLAGVVFYNVQERVRQDGSHYVIDSSHVLGRIMNADLRRLGF